MDDFTPRELDQISMAKDYAEKYSTAGAPGHSHLMLIAKLANALQKANDDHAYEMNLVYTDRNKVVAMASHLAHLAGYKTGHKADPQAPTWPCIFIDLPTGQVSWHVPILLTSAFLIDAYDGEWDGHTNNEKTKRIYRFAKWAVYEGS